MATDDVQRLDAAIDGLRRDHGSMRERIGKVEQRAQDHSEQLGKVTELEKGMVKLNTQFGEFRDGVKEDLTEIRGSQDKMLALFNADLEEREKEKKEYARQRESRIDRKWNRLLQVAAIAALVLVTLAASYITKGAF